MNVRVVAVIRAVIITAALGTAACSSDTTLPPGSPTPVNQNATVAGMVWLHDTGNIEPDANVQVNAWVQNAKCRMAPRSHHLRPGRPLQFYSPDRRFGPPPCPS